MSGRYRTRNRGTVDQAFCIDLASLRRRRALRPGARTTGDMSWSRHGEALAAIDLTIDLTNPENGFVMLHFAANGEPRSQVVSLDADPCRFGGRRFYFRCPRSYRRCEALFCVDAYFASRQYHRLTYASQSLDALQRMHRGSRRAEARALGLDGYPRPRGANRERLADRWEAYEEASDQMLAVWMASRFPDLMHPA